MLGQQREPLGLSDLDQEQILDLSSSLLEERKTGPQILSSFVIQLSVGFQLPSSVIQYLPFLFISGVGTFQAKIPSEQPEHTYHFSWTTSFACPNQTSPNGTVCCNYDNSNFLRSLNGGARNKNMKKDSRSTCSLSQSSCPSSLGMYSYTGNTTVSS